MFGLSEIRRSDPGGSLTPPVPGSLMERGGRDALPELSPQRQPGI